MKKRFFIIMLLVLIVISLIGCSGSGSANSGSVNSDSADSDSADSDSADSSLADSDLVNNDANESSNIWGVSSTNVLIPPSTSEQMVRYFQTEGVKAQTGGVPKINVGRYALEKTTSNYYGSIKWQCAIDYDNNQIVEVQNRDGEPAGVIAEFDENYNIISNRRFDNFKYNNDGAVVQVTENGNVYDSKLEYDASGNIIWYEFDDDALSVLNHFVLFDPSVFLGDREYGSIEVNPIVYNSENRITQYGMFNMEYDNGMISKVTWEDKQALLEWDDHGNILSITGDIANPLGGDELRFQYLYDDDGNILFERAITDNYLSFGSYNTHFDETHDVDYPGAIYYSYDSNGNRVVACEYSVRFYNYEDKIYTWKTIKGGETLVGPPDIGIYGEYIAYPDIYLFFHKSFEDISLLDILYDNGRRYATSLYCKFIDEENATVSGYMQDGSRIDGTIKLDDYEDLHYQKVTVTFTGGDSEGLSAELIGNTYVTYYLPYN